LQPYQVGFQHCNHNKLGSKHYNHLKAFVCFNHANEPAFLTFIT
jgi:hypothetical protein